MLSGLLDAYKKELGEFVSTVKEDTSRVVSKAAEQLKKLNEPTGERLGSRPAAYPDSFAEFVECGMWEDDPALADFEETFDLSAKADARDSAKAQVASELAYFVPEKLEEDTFWLLYFFFQHVQRRARLLAGDLANQEEEEEFSWWDDEDAQEEAVVDKAKEARARGRAQKEEASKETGNETVEILKDNVKDLQSRLEIALEENDSLKAMVKDLSTENERLRSLAGKGEVLSTQVVDEILPPQVPENAREVNEREVEVEPLHSAESTPTNEPSVTTHVVQEEKVAHTEVQNETTVDETDNLDVEAVSAAADESADSKSAETSSFAKVEKGSADGEEENLSWEEEGSPNEDEDGEGGWGGWE